MRRKAKSLSVIACAMFAFSAATALSANATVEFHSEKSSTVITGNAVSSDVFTTDVGEIKCATTTYSGSMTGSTTTEFTVTPIYSGCTVFGFKAQIHMNGCWYALKSSSFDIICPTGKSIVVTGPGCEITYPTQFAVGAPMWTWGGGSGVLRKIFGHFFFNQARYIEHGALCVSSTVEKKNGKISTTAEFRGETGGGSAVGIWVE